MHLGPDGVCQRRASYQILFRPVMRGVWEKDSEIDRAHRSLAAKPSPALSPLHRHRIKDLLIREARRRGTLEYRGQQIHAVEEYGPEVLSQCAKHREVMSEPGEPFKKKKTSQNVFISKRFLVCCVSYGFYLVVAL